MKNRLLHTGAFTSLLLLATACSKTEDATPTDNTSNDNLLLGNPSGAVANTASPLVLQAPVVKGPGVRWR